MTGMVFSSMTFIYCFLPVVFLLYFASKNIAWRNAVLLVSSLVFYSWGEPTFVILMIATSLVAYLGAMAISKPSWCYARKPIFITTVILIVLNLFVFKYFNFAVSIVESISNQSFGFETIALPIGISFYTFQILSYVIDLYNGKVSLQKNYLKLLLYVCLFPQLIAGPIVRYSTVEYEIDNRSTDLEDVIVGLRRFVIGLSKKLLLSNGLAHIAEIVYKGDPGIYGSLMYWVAAISYALEIYFDFSGYSDMAIGLGRIFGFHFFENFEHPYIATSVTDFWRRWHISLSSWFRDYIYIPMGGNRVNSLRWIFNILVVWALTGLWHGASWNFVLWGLYYAVFLILEKLALRKVLDKMPTFVRVFYTIFVVILGWVIFNMTDLSKLGLCFSMMFSAVATDFTKMVAADSEILVLLLYIPIGIICSLPIGTWIKNRIDEKYEEKLSLKYPRGMRNRRNRLPKGYPIWLEALFNLGSLMLLFLCIVFVLSTKFNPFIYFRF